ncbi:MAG: site-2 protease family protein [Chitinophagaceae bacterium]|nr:site-2 protease family protein [Chitinophagaceae bacterium]
MNEDNTIFKQKPALEEMPAVKAIWLKALLSLILYIGVYYFLFHLNIKWILLLVVVIIIHEAGHFIAMKYFKYKDVQLFFIPFLGAFVSGKPDIISQKQKIITLLAGPLPGIVTGLLLFVLFRYNNQFFYYQLSLMFVLLNIFNLLPVSPLDGGQLIENLSPGTNKIIQPIFLIISGIALFYIAIITHNYFVILIVWLIVTRLRKQIMQNQILSDLDKSFISYNKSYENLSDEEYMTIRKTIINRVPSLKNYNVNEVSDNEEPVIVYIHKILHNSAKNDMTLQHKILVIFIWAIFIAIPIIIYALYAPGYRIFQFYK